MKSRLLLVALVASVSLTGCGGDPSPAPAPSSSTPSPTASPTPTPPQLPAAATKRTPAGAKAFVRHFLDLMKFAGEGHGTAELRSQFDKACRGCESLADFLDSTYARGGYIHGGFWRPGRLITYGWNGRQFPVDALIDAGPQRYQKRAGGKVFSAKPLRHELHMFVLTWTGSSWVTSGLDEITKFEDLP